MSSIDGRTLYEWRARHATRKVWPTCRRSKQLLGPFQWGWWPLAGEQQGFMSLQTPDEFGGSQWRPFLLVWKSIPLDAVQPVLLLQVFNAFNIHDLLYRRLVPPLFLAFPQVYIPALGVASSRHGMYPKKTYNNLRFSCEKMQNMIEQSNLINA